MTLPLRSTNASEVNKIVIIMATETTKISFFIALGLFGYCPLVFLVNSFITLGSRPQTIIWVYAGLRQKQQNAGGTPHNGNLSGGCRG